MTLGVVLIDEAEAGARHLVGLAWLLLGEGDEDVVADGRDGEGREAGGWAQIVLEAANQLEVIVKRLDEAVDEVSRVKAAPERTGEESGPLNTELNCEKSTATRARMD